MKNVFISQPMRGLTSDEIKSNRSTAIKDIKKFVLNKYGEEVNIIDSYFEDTPRTKLPALWWLGQSICKLSEADIVYCLKGYENARGCRIEALCAKEYGIEIIEES